MIWVWIAGGLVLACAAVVPALAARRRASRSEYVTARDRARSVLSRLDWALDAAPAAGGDEAEEARAAGGTAAVSDPAAMAEARRCRTMAGSALAGPDTTDGFRQAERWARRGLSALGVSAGDDPDR